MSVINTQSTWREANQRHLVAEFARLKTRLTGKSDSVAGESMEAMAERGETAASAINVLTEQFSLSAFERDILLLCAGVEMDSELARACGEAQGGDVRSSVTFALALAALEQAHWSALAPTAPLRRWRLVEVDDRAGLVVGKLRIDERVLHYLAGINYLDPRLQPLLSPVASPAVMAGQHRHICRTICDHLQEEISPVPVVLLCGDDGDGQSDVAAAVAAQLHTQLYGLQAEDLPTSLAEVEAFATLWQREAALLGAGLLIQCRDAAPPRAVMQVAEHTGSLLFLAGRDVPSVNRPTFRFAVNKPDSSEQKDLWQQVLGPATARLNGSLDEVASQFCLSAQTILTTGAGVREAVTASNRPDELLWSACRTASRSRLEDLAQRIEPAAGWDDLVVPDAQRQTLRQIAAQANHRFRVYEQWGFAGKGTRGLGISALFAGESGTGKTMAAEVLAQELHLDLYRIDLSSVVSKYIGETEKNLKRTFDAAEHTGAILLFDEADALFGKRSEVKDSHDRYANIEVSYLLQRMEAYRGLAILTTNIKAALDTAFQRRLRFVVQFPFPDQTQREAIWRGIFPARVPLQGLDYGKLARLQVAGGNIRNIALNAAFLAAEAAKPVTMQHLLSAARIDAAKRERTLSDAEIRGWV